MPKLRLVKVLVQPVFMLDDGENVTEIDHPAVAIPAAEWPTYSSERFPAELAAWQAQLDGVAVGDGALQPNREQRRRDAKKTPRPARAQSGRGSAS